MAQTKRRSPCKHARRRLITTWMDDELSGNTTWGRMSISFNVLGYLLNMKGGGWEYIRRPQSPEEFVIKRPPKKCAHWNCWRLPWTHLLSCCWLRGVRGVKMEFTPVLCSVCLRRTDRPRIICRPTWCTSTGTSDRTFPGLWILWSRKSRSMRTPCRAWWLKVRFYFFYSISWLCTGGKIRAYSRGLVQTCPVWHKWRPVKAAAVPDDHRGSQSTSRTTSHISGGDHHEGISVWNSLSNSQSKPPFSLNTWCWLDISPDAPLYKSLVKSNQQLPSVLFSHLAWLD